MQKVNFENLRLVKDILHSRFLFRFVTTKNEKSRFRIINHTSMKLSRLIIAAGITILSAITLVSCEGPAGAAGAQGISGPTGAPGPQPLVGIYVIPDTAWTLSTSVSNQYYCQISDTNLTDFNNDVVLVYAQGSSGPTADFYALPVTNILAANDALSYSYNTATITLYYTNSAGTVVQPTTPLTIKTVIMVPAIIKQHPNVNYKDYHAVMALLTELKAGKASH